MESTQLLIQRWEKEKEGKNLKKVVFLNRIKINLTICSLGLKGYVYLFFLIQIIDNELFMLFCERF